MKISIYPSSNKAFKSQVRPYVVYWNAWLPHSIFYNNGSKSVQQLFLNKFQFKFLYFSNKVLFIFYDYYFMSLYYIFMILFKDYCLIFLSWHVSLTNYVANSLFQCLLRFDKIFQVRYVSGWITDQLNMT